MKIIPAHDRQGMFKTIMNRTSLRHWIKKENTNIGHECSDENVHTVRRHHSEDLARFVLYIFNIVPIMFGGTITLDNLLLYYLEV